MTAMTQSRSGYIDRPRSSSLADVIDIILDKGLVIDAYVRVSLVGIEVLTIDARIVIASVDTYLRFAEAVNRLDLEAKGGKDLPEMMESLNQSGSKGKTSGVLSGVKEAIGRGGDNKDEGADRKEREPEQEASRRSSR
jgi:gas vesicle structural protein